MVVGVLGTVPGIIQAGLVREWRYFQAICCSTWKTPARRLRLAGVQDAGSGQAVQTAMNLNWRFREPWVGENRRPVIRLSENYETVIAFS